MNDRGVEGKEGGKGKRDKYETVKPFMGEISCGEEAYARDDTEEAAEGEGGRGIWGARKNGRLGSSSM